VTTKGSLKVGGKSFYLQSDASPEHATLWLKRALAAKPRTIKEFVGVVNILAGFDWIYEELKSTNSFFDSPFEEYRWVINLRDSTFRLDREHRARHLKRVEEAWKRTSKK